VFRAVWRSLPGTVVLYGAMILHFYVVLISVYRRRSLRMSWGEGVQVGAGLLLPPLLMAHGMAARGVHETFGVDDRYAYVLLGTYVSSPYETAKLIAGTVLAWGHGVIGLHFWLRLKPGYERWRTPLLLLGVLLPTLAIAGFLGAGREVAAMAQDPGWVDAFAASIGLKDFDAVVAWHGTATNSMLAATGGILLLTLVARAIRGARERRRGIVIVSYPEGRQARAYRGMSVLEVSRAAGIPHASVCGGRGRCSTCRVRVIEGEELLAPATPEEQRVLDRVGAPVGVRLACQIRPATALEVAPLLAPSAGPRDGYARSDESQGREAEIVVVFVDLRDFTGFSERKLPYDVVFVINQYARVMGRAVEDAGGRIDKFIGDGVMALFGLSSGPVEGARQSLVAARAMAAALDDLNRILSSDLDEPLRFGIGMHVGPAVVGEMGYGEARSVTAIGDTVNTASRLEQATKEFGCELVISADLAVRAGVDMEGFGSHEIEVRGRAEPLTVYAVDRAYRTPVYDAGTTPSA
jgi:adenylate cyclase